ncbi:MAG: radical SAM protein, partial [Prevotellaceae bacterium]|nr:radical SAM protein [Prevotellaceae bacterium]
KSQQHGYLLFNFLSGTFLDINDKKTRNEINKIKEDINNYDFSDKPETLNLLLSSGIICEDDSINENITLLKSVYQRFNENIKTFVIMPTLNCNLACTYCYAGKNLKYESISNEVLEQLKIYIKEECHAKVKKIFLQWYGGEPLLEFDIIKNLSSFIKSLNIPFYADIVTNGVLLTEEKINLLKDLEINTIQITLDGIKKTHDKKRKFKNNKGTYDIIMKNLLILHSYLKQHKEISVNIRINIDKDNKNEYHVIYSYIKEKFPLFYPYPGIITQYQTCNNNINCITDKTEIAEYFFEQYQKHGIKSIEYRSLIKGIMPCMAECMSTNMIGPKGEMYLCLKDVGDEKEVIGNIFIGKRNLSLVSEYCVGGIRFNNIQCHKCKVFWLCGGGCPNHKYRNKKYGENHDICNPIKNIEVLKKFLDLHYEIKKTKSHE